MPIQESDLHVLYLTKNCDLSCKYCYEGADKCNEKMLNETIIEAIDYIMAKTPENVKAKILLFGGEPLMNWEGCKAAMDRGQFYRDQGRHLIMTITTNGTLLKPDKVKEMYKHRSFMSIQISIDGDAQTHDSFRVFKSGHGSHSIVVKNVAYALRYFPFSQARMVITDVDRFFINVKYLADIGFRNFCIQALRFNDGEMQSNYYCDKFTEELDKCREYIKTLNNVQISEVQYPQSCQRNDTMKQEAANSDNMYKYFLPDGGKVFQKTFTEEGFQHFTKGENVGYNLFKE